MSEQYAFAIGFDREPEETSERPNDDDWAHLLEAVSTAISEARLPSIDSERWDEFGQGRVFWGTLAECASVRAILLRFELYVEEDRNLDPGYYATVDHTYCVDPVGQIYVVPGNGVDPHRPLETTNSIPLDAYRAKAIDPELDAQVQAKLQAMTNAAPRIESAPAPLTSASSPQVSTSDDTTVPAEETLLAPTIELEAYDARQRQLEQQTAEILALEQQLRTALTQVDNLSQEGVTKVDRSVHEPLRLQCEQQAQQLEELQSQLDNATAQVEAARAQMEGQFARINGLEQAIVQAQAQAREWQARAEQAIDSAIDPEAYETVQQKSSAQTTQILELQRFVQRLEQQLQDATAQSAGKVNLSKYESLEQESKDKSALIADLRHTLQQQERDLREWQTVAEAKVDWAEHQELQAELQRLQARQKRGLFSRLFGWLWR
jgi:hypothetical protein